MFAAANYFSDKCFTCKTIIVLSYHQSEGHVCQVPDVLARFSGFFALEIICDTTLEASKVGVKGTITPISALITTVYVSCRSATPLSERTNGLPSPYSYHRETEQVRYSRGVGATINYMLSI